MTAFYIRMARQAGHSWHDIGCALNMMQGSMTGNMHESIADTAFSYASSHEPHTSIFDSHVTWQCCACENTIKDHGPNSDPIMSEQGHAGHCTRHAEAITAWNADRKPLMPTGRRRRASDAVRTTSRSSLTGCRAAPPSG